MDKIDAIMIVLAIFSVTLLTIDFLFPLSYEEQKLISYTDLCVVGIFWIEFVYKFWKADKKLRFIKQRWADIIGMIPLTELTLRIFRLFRIVRIMRVTKAITKIKRGEKIIKSTRKAIKKLRK